MGEAAKAPAIPQGGVVAGRGRSKWLNPLEALESGFALFQATFAAEAWSYYAGAAPLIVAAILIWVIDGQVQLSDADVFAQAALLAGAHWLRTWMAARYMQRVRERAFGVPRTKFAGVSARAAAVGRLLAWKIALSAAALATLATFAGAPWFYTAGQFAALEARDDASERHSLRGCLMLAGRWYAPGLLLFLLLIPLWVGVFLNVTIMALIVPELLHSIFGLNTLLSTQTGMQSLAQSSAFWLSLFAGTWLALDPVIKCTFVVVYQHLRSRREGDDLRGLLAGLPRDQQKKAEMVAVAGSRRGAAIGAFVLLAAALLCATPARQVYGAQTQSSDRAARAAVDATTQARVQKLSEALNKESQSAVYRWHDAEHPEPPTWFDRMVGKFENAMIRVRHAVWTLLKKMWPSGLHLSLGNGSEGSWHVRDVRLWIAIVAGLAVTIGAFLIWLRRRRRAISVSVPVETVPLPDLSDMAIADEQPEDEWFALANRLEAEGDLRLAFRAAYLGLLSGLARREWLTIRRDRTNREYLDEFTRRWKRRPQAVVDARIEIPEKLRKSIRQFDSVWYGYRALTPAAVTAYRQDQRELLDHV